MHKDKVIVCCQILDEELVKRVKKKRISVDDAQTLAELFKIFADPTRIKILHALLTHELCVCDLSAVVEMNQSAISHQLRLLKDARLVKFQKIGKTVYYALDDKHIQKILSFGRDHIQEREGSRKKYGKKFQIKES